MSGNPTLYMVTECCKNGYLFDYVASLDGLPEPIAKQIVLQLLHLIEFIHYKKVQNRTLKLFNLWLDENC
jgi:serine/threonine protein kinase